MNKRHYEHTLPNIRGSLSNTYGGLLYHGIPDKSFAVTLQPFHGWQIHT